MDRYTFRGKSVHTNDWIYGGYAELEGVACIILPHIEYNDECQREEPVYIAIDPATVGQSTGITDKNERVVFEGDIVQVDAYSYHIPEDSARGAIEISAYGYGMRKAENGEWAYLCDLIGSSTTIFEVIGNVHDDPDLLEE